MSYDEQGKLEARQRKPVKRTAPPKPRLVRFQFPRDWTPEQIAGFVIQFHQGSVARTDR